MLNNTIVRIVRNVAAMLVGQPQDTVRGKMELFPKKYSGMVSCQGKIVKLQQFHGLYAGMTLAITSLTGYDAKLLNWKENAAAGGISSLFKSPTLCPTELIKIHKQDCGYTLNHTNKPEHLTTGTLIKDIWKEMGFKSFYRELWVTMARESVNSMAFYNTYKLARKLLQPVSKRKEDIDNVYTMAAGDLSGVNMWLSSYPMDLIKSRVQMSNRSINDEFRANWSTNGSPRTLYSGVWPIIAKQFISKPFPSSTSDQPTVDSPTSSPLKSKASDSPTRVPADPVANEFFSFCDFISGWVAGVISTIVGHPMDTVKVVQQVTNSDVRNAIKSISNQKNFSVYFRGMMLPILLAGLMNSVFFGVYGNTMRLIQRRRSNDPSENVDNIRYCCDSENLHNMWHLDLFVSGCIGGVFYSMINVPSEVVKTMLQASSTSIPKLKNLEDSGKINTSVKLIIELYKTYGIRSLYRGGTLLMIRDVPSMGIYVLIYEHLYCFLRTFSNSETKKNPVSEYIPVIAGGVSGIMSWIFFLPFDVIKSKIIADSLTQPQYRSAWDCAVKTYRDGGVPRFFRGFWLICIRAFPVNGITFMVYELVLKSCTDN